MLSPPNQGSEVVDKLSHLALYQWLNGPAGMELGTDKAALPVILGAADFELGVITGKYSINPILSQLIPGPDDGKVAVERAKLDGMADFLVVGSAHPFIMQNDQVIRQTLYFLQYGYFNHGEVGLHGTARHSTAQHSLQTLPCSTSFFCL